MQIKRYLDTYLYLYLCETDDKTHSCHPDKKEGDIISSYLACEEALYLYINNYPNPGKFRNNYTNLISFMEKLNKFNMKITMSGKNLDEVYSIAQEIIRDIESAHIRMVKSSILKLKHKEKLLDAMDIFHLAYADSEGCKEFATTDTGFSLFKNQRFRNSSLQNIKEILIFDTKTITQINDTIKIPVYTEKQ